MISSLKSFRSCVLSPKFASSFKSSQSSNCNARLAAEPFLFRRKTKPIRVFLNGECFGLPPFKRPTCWRASPCRNATDVPATSIWSWWSNTVPRCEGLFFFLTVFACPQSGGQSPMPYAWPRHCATGGFSQRPGIKHKHSSPLLPRVSLDNRTGNKSQPAGFCLCSPIYVLKRRGKWHSTGVNLKRFSYTCQGSQHGTTHVLAKANNMCELSMISAAVGNPDKSKVLLFAEVNNLSSSSALNLKSAFSAFLQ